MSNKTKLFVPRFRSSSTVNAEADLARRIASGRARARAQGAQKNRPRDAPLPLVPVVDRRDIDESLK